MGSLPLNWGPSSSIENPRWLTLLNILLNVVKSPNMMGFGDTVGLRGKNIRVRIMSLSVSSSKILTVDKQSLLMFVCPVLSLSALLSVLPVAPPPAGPVKHLSVRTGTVNVPWPFPQSTVTPPLPLSTTLIYYPPAAAFGPDPVGWRPEDDFAALFFIFPRFLSPSIPASVRTLHRTTPSVQAGVDTEQPPPPPLVPPYNTEGTRKRSCASSSLKSD